MSDYGVIVSEKDSDVKKLENIIFTSKYVTAKLDTSKDVSFQDILLTFDNDPPAPVSGILVTKVYSVEHGYNYKPSIWSLVSIVSPSFGVLSDFQQDFFQEAGVISSHSSDDEASFYVDADDTYVNFYVRKFKSGALDDDNDLSTYVLRVRLYVFAEDVNE